MKDHTTYNFDILDIFVLIEKTETTPDGGEVAPVTNSGANTAATPVPEEQELDVTAVNKQITVPRFIAALPSGEAAVVNNGSQVFKINSQGQTVAELYDCNSCYNIYGLVLLGINLYVIHKNGTLVEIQSMTGEILEAYTIFGVNTTKHYGTLGSDPSKIPHTDILLIPDDDKGEVFSYNLTSKVKTVHLTGLESPTSVTYFFSKSSVFYIVCQHTATVNVYNSSWHLLFSFGQKGRDDENLYYPYGAIVSSNNSVIVGDKGNNRLSVFTMEGEFLHHIPIAGIKKPYALSYFKPYLWVRYKTRGFKLLKYRLDY